MWGFNATRGQPSLVALGDRARDNGEWDAAVALYSSALARDLRNPRLWVQFGHALKESGKLQDPAKLARAEAAYRRALIYAPRVADTHLQLGHVLKLQGRRDEAKAGYLRALALDPALATAREELWRGRPEEAKGAYLRALALDASLTTVRDELRALGWDEGDGAALHAALVSLEGIAPPRRRRPSLIEQADTARDAAQWALAARRYRAFLERDPGNAPIWVQYGHALKEAGNLTDPAHLIEAEAAYRRALAIAPTGVDTHLQLGHVLKLQGKTKEAEAAYLCAFTLDPTSPLPGEELRNLCWSDAALSELNRLMVDSDNNQAVDPPRELVIQEPFHQYRGFRRYNGNKTRSLLISILSFGRPENVIGLLAPFPEWLRDFISRHNFEVTIVIRNNDPTTSFGLVHDVARTEPLLDIHVIDNGPNLGFGRGHNTNYRAYPSDYVLILNDDLIFFEMSWLERALDLMERNINLAFVGADSNPQTISPFFANGHFPHSGRIDTLRYVEASVMIMNGDIFKRIGMFNEQIEWAMCEDSDLSLRAQSLGYDIDWIPIPHQHARSSSFNTLPTEVKFSISEHNRATLIAAWRSTLASGKIGKYTILDVWSDGMGDVFCVLPHIYGYLKTLTPLQKSTIIVNTSFIELFELILESDIKLESIEDMSLLVAAYNGNDLATVRTIRDINYSAPIHLQTVLCGALSIPISSGTVLDEFANVLRKKLYAYSESPTISPETCVIHLESSRQNHQGRFPSAQVCATVAKYVSQQFSEIIIIGQAVQWKIDTTTASMKDLRQKTSLIEMITLISHARYFVGVDSFPWHVAQVFGVRSAILFGAVHPLARVWNETKVWPITAVLPCIGCYHTHLEPSVPFCMRRDEACMTMISEKDIEAQLLSMKQGVIFNWETLRTRYRDLQAKFFQYLRFHPAPTERVFRSKMPSNEKVGNLIFEITDKIADMVSETYHTAAIERLRTEVKKLKSRLNEQ